METLDPRVQVLWIGRAVLVASVLAGVALAVDAFVRPLDVRFVAGGWAAIALLGAVHARLLYRSWRFAIEDDALFLQRGVLTRVDTSVPYVRVQHTDTRRGPIERTAGLASVVVYTAGSRGADIRIPGLDPERADDLRRRLRELAVESETADAV